jgi:hypothetical protein
MTCMKENTQFDLAMEPLITNGFDGLAGATRGALRCLQRATTWILRAFSQRVKFLMNSC